MELAVSSVGPYRVHERSGPNRWRGSAAAGGAPVRVCLVDGPAAAAAAARRGFARGRLLPVLHVEPAPAGALGGGAAFVVVAEPGGPTLREAVARGGPLGPAAAAGLALLLAEPLRALGERGLAHGGVSPDAIVLPGGERAEPALGAAGFDAEALGAFRPPGAGAAPADVDRWGLVGCLWFALRGAPPAPAAGRHAAPAGRRGGRAPGRGGREALEAIARRGLSPGESDRYTDWVTLMVDLGAWLERYGGAPAGERRRPWRLERPAAAPPSLEAGDARARQTLTDAWPARAAAPPSGAPTPGPWAAVDDGPAAGPAGGAGPGGRARGGRRALAAAALVGAGVLGGGGAVWLGQRAAGAGSPGEAGAAGAAPAPAAAAPAGDEGAGAAGLVPAGARLVAPLRDGSPGAIYACVAAGFAPRAFEPGHDFRPLCAEPDAPSGARLVRRALAAGGRGARGGSAAMREWAHYGWYELAVVSALRDRCCGDFPPTRLPPTPAPCGSLHEALARVGVAANAASEPGLDLAVDDYHERSDCAAREGYAPLYGRAEGVRRGEETNFRVFVRRFRRAARPAAGAGDGRPLFEKPLSR